MIPDIYYVNSQNKKIDLLEPPYMLQTGTLFDSKWEYEYLDSENSGSITAIKKALEEKEMTLSVIGADGIGFEEAADKLHEAFDTDVILQSPGRLYVGEMYMECYMVASEKSEWENDADYMDVDLTIVAECPVWIGKETYTFHSFDSNPTANIKKYPYQYPYRYANGSNKRYIINDNFLESDFKMYIYGPVVKPQVTIGENIYLVNIVLEKGERLEIDTMSRTIVKIMRNGSRVNAFHYRQKGTEFFKKIKTGRQIVSWAGKFDFDIVLIEKRGEPRWSRKH